MSINSPNPQQNEIQAVVSDIDKVPKGKYENAPLIETTEKERAELDRFKNDTELKRNLTVFVVCNMVNCNYGICLSCRFLRGYRF